MRLIDADALLKRKGCVYDSEGHVLFAVGTGDIVHAPTIAAIPVEWLESMLDETAMKNVELNNAIFQVLVAWEREKQKEAR